MATSVCRGSLCPSNPCCACGAWTAAGVCRSGSGSSNFGATLPSAAAGTGTLRAGSSGSYDTAAAAAAAGMGTGTVRAGSFPVGTGTLQSAAAAGGGLPGSDLQVITGPTAAAAAAGGGQQHQKPVYARLPSLQQLSVDVNALNPEASSAAGGLVGAPVGAGGGAIPIMASRLVWQDGSSSSIPAAGAAGAGGGAAAGGGEGGAVLARVLLPALQSLQAPGGGASQLQVGAAAGAGG